MTIVSFSKGTGALSTLTQIQKSEGMRTTSVSKISSSSKIRKASDAVADSAIGTKLKVEVESLKQLLIGTAQAKAALDIAEGGLNEMTQILTRMNTLAMSAKNGVYKESEVEKINDEFVNLVDEIDRIAKSTNFNSKQLLSGKETVIKDNFENTHLGNDLRDGFLSKEQQGIDSITIDNSKSDTAYVLSYDQQTRLFSVTSLNDKTEVDSLKVSADEITEGNFEELNFSKAGLKITLNSNFDKNKSIGSEKDSMMSTALNNDNIKNTELKNSIDSDLIDANPTSPELTVFKAKTISGLRIEGGSDDFTLSGKINTPETDLANISTAFDLTSTDFTLGTINAAGAGALDATQLDTLNTTLSTQSLNITSVEWAGALTDSGSATAAATETIKFSGNFSAFQITAFDQETGIATFEATQALNYDNTLSNIVTGNATIKGSIQIDKNTFENSFKAMDFSSQSIVKDHKKGEAIVLKGGTYKLKDNDIVAADGFVYDKTTGKKSLTTTDNPDSTIQLKLDNTKRTNDLDIVNITNNLTDINSFDVKIKGTNGKAVLYLEAENGALESEEFNLTDIDYNDGINKSTNKYNASDDNSSYIAKNKLTRGQITLKRVISNGLREDSITIDLNKLKTGGLIEAKNLTDAGAPKNLAQSSAGMEATDLAGTAPFEHSDSFKNNKFVTLNELKNTVVAYQDSSDKTSLSFQVGTGSNDSNSINVTIASVTSSRLNLIDQKSNKALELTSDQESLQNIIAIVQTAIDTVQTVRSEVAVGDNRLNIADSSIQTSITNSQAAVSAIFDLDIPSEMVELSQSEMMEQSSIEALAREMRAKQNLMKLF